MTFDSDTRTIKIEPIDSTQTFVDMTVSNIDLLWRLSNMPKASDRLKQDAKIICEWLGQDIGPLTPTSYEKLKTGILGYASIGVAPIPALQRTAEMLQVKEGSYPRPPAEIVDVFDRLFAPNEKVAALIAEKRKYDDLAKKVTQNKASRFSQNLQRIHNGEHSNAEKLSKKSLIQGVSARVRQSSDYTRIFLVVTAVWTFWVWLRTATRFELVGYYFKRWDRDMFLPNVLVVPVLILVARGIHKLYVRKFRNDK